LKVIPQAQLKVDYAGVEVGEYSAGFLAEGCVIVELKSVERLVEEPHAQL
jgi:GxxExxY protein